MRHLLRRNRRAAEGRTPMSDAIRTARTDALIPFIA